MICYYYSISIIRCCDELTKNSNTISIAVHMIPNVTSSSGYDLGRYGEVGQWYKKTCEDFCDEAGVTVVGPVSTVGCEKKDASKFGYVIK